MRGFENVFGNSYSTPEFYSRAQNWAYFGLRERLAGFGLSCYLAKIRLGKLKSDKMGKTAIL